MTCLCDEESHGGLKIFALDKPGNKSDDIWNSDTVDSLISNELFLNLSVLCVILLNCINSKSVNDLPLVIIESNQVLNMSGVLLELEQLDGCSHGFHCCVENVDVLCSEIVEQVFVFLFSGECDGL